MTLKVLLLQENFAGITSYKKEFAREFYQRLFAQYPQLQAYFHNVSLDAQEKKLFDTLQFVIDNLEQSDVLISACRALGLYHEKLHIRPGHYTMVGSVLVETIANYSGEKWNNELREAWIDAYRTIVTAMLTEGATKTN